MLDTALYIAGSLGLAAFFFWVVWEVELLLWDLLVEELLWLVSDCDPRPILLAGRLMPLFAA